MHGEMIKKKTIHQVAVPRNKRDAALNLCLAHSSVMTIKESLKLATARFVKKVPDLSCSSVRIVSLSKQLEKTTVKKCVSDNFKKIIKIVISEGWHTMLFLNVGYQSFSDDAQYHRRRDTPAAQPSRPGSSHCPYLLPIQN